MSRPRRLLLLADHVHPYVYREGFPRGLGHIDLVLAAGDLPGYYLEFVATMLPAPLVYVPGNHADEYVRDEDGERLPPRGVQNAHGRVLRVAGLTLAGWGGVPRYREGEGQYTAAEARWGLARLDWQLRLPPRPLDILLTHAPPLGPHAGSDHAHRGCGELSRFMRRQRPGLLVHGHIHEYEGKKTEYTDPQSATRVVNAYGYRVVEF
ncbi:metallophosphoesterase [Deinococcus sp. VB142]|uniref:Metallophosphoesterase n=1 Tax=Deinococcus sp. VB142 TaxID=3112952 RepID=A0AAU6Q151_9DEIO